MLFDEKNTQQITSRRKLPQNDKAIYEKPTADIVYNKNQMHFYTLTMSNPKRQEDSNDIYNSIRQNTWE